jgi:phenylpropionate dioxygenase-like ring-hydroxylating dioxygenase large terminal subunit
MNAPIAFQEAPRPAQASFVHNAWYPAARGEDVGRALTKQRLLGERLVLYRTGAGAPVALADRCPHRSAPLSLGKLRGDTVECGYHGMTFDCAGACVRVPAQGRVPPGAKVRAYPALERYGLVFVWMGEAALADPALLPAIPQYGRPEWGVSRGYSFFRSGYRNITDNLVDPAHTSFVHAGSIGNAAAEDVPVRTEVEGDVLSIGRWIENAPPVPVIARFTRSDANMDRWQRYHLKAPCTSWVDFGAFAPGSPRTEEAKNAAPYRVLSYAFLAPETARGTHYFWFQLRNFAAGDAAITAEFEELYRRVFNEDRELLEAIQVLEDEDPAFSTVRIASDAGLTRLRRMVEGMLDAEQAQGSTRAARQGSPDEQVER